MTFDIVYEYFSKKNNHNERTHTHAPNWKEKETLDYDVKRIRLTASWASWTEPQFLYRLSFIPIEFLLFYINQWNFTGLVEVKRPAFYAGSRYGRSNGGQSSGLRIAPRRDFHFLRYGKRANDHDDIHPIQCYEPNRNYVLTCSFTGFRDFYRCWKG